MKRDIKQTHIQTDIATTRYLGMNPGDRNIHFQEVVKEMLRVVLEGVSVLVKR
jgi:hypothetical protein